MKKLLSIIITISLLIGMVSISALADDYVTDWTIETDKPSYVPGDYMKVYITNSKQLINVVQGGTIQFTYNPDLVTLVTQDEIYEAWMSSEKTVLTDATTPVSCDSDIGGGVANGEVIGIISGTFASASPIVRITAGATIMVAYFKVNADVLGAQTANFSFVYKDTDGVAESNNTTYVYNGTGANKTTVDINYVDASAVINGGAVSSTNVTGVTFVPGVYPTESSPCEVVLNDVSKTVVSITTPYIVGYSSVVAKNDAAMKEAGVVIADGSATTVDISNCKEKIAAQRFTNNNRFGILIYGSYLKAGSSYKLRFYITYSDDSTVYSDVFPISL